jgi:hypothetical protein
VIDPSGASVAGAKVVLRKTSKKLKNGAEVGQRVSDKDGKFVFAIIEPGLYDLEISKTAFKEARIRSVKVVAKKDSTVKAGLVPAKGGQTFVTCDPATSIDVTSSEVSHNYGNDCSGSLMKGAPEPRDLGDLLNT